MLALLGPTITPAHATDVEITKRVWACYSPGMEEFESFKDEEKGIALVNAKRQPYEAPMVSSRACRWFEPRELHVVMTTDPTDPRVCVTDEFKQGLDHPCYWIPKKIIKAPL